jgi:hypothetical protein
MNHLLARKAITLVVIPVLVMKTSVQTVARLPARPYPSLVFSTAHSRDRAALVL